MLESSVEDACTMGEERRALTVARTVLRNHRLLITKRPNDIFWIDELREYYRSRRADARFIVTLRDPRAVLTSIHGTLPGVYYVTPERWSAIYSHYQYVREFSDVLVVRFEDLVLDTSVVEQRLAELLGLELTQSLDRFHETVPENFNTGALNGVRPVDPKAVDKWKHPDHANRIREVLEAIPELPGALIDLGYEQDDGWTHAYRSAATSVKS